MLEAQETLVEERSLSTETRPVNYRALMRKVEQLVAELERVDDVGAVVRSLIETLIVKFRAELGIYGGRLYRRQGDDYVVQATFGQAKSVQGLKIPLSYPPIEVLLEQGAVVMDADDSRADLRVEGLLGAQRFAAIEVGDEDYILAFDVEAGHHKDDILFSLGILRHSLNQAIRRGRMQGIFEEARKIQASILPRRAPSYGRFDLVGRSEPMESVGGDFFDYIPVTEKILGLAIADVSGHGLPAALQVRDIYMGLRMGLARDFKIIRTVERMNRIIHQSTLTSRFVSLFYGELELNGVFIYVNAGHPPPFHLKADGTYQLMEEGGPVLGPLEQASYERGFVILKPGDMVVFYTDGICEAHGREADDMTFEEYGLDRLIQVARENRGRPAQVIVDAVFESVDAFVEGAAPEDDRTVMVVTYPEADPNAAVPAVAARRR
jgi:serine phosphatase RsbU (regulator of sigma subunit)